MLTMFLANLCPIGMWLAYTTMTWTTHWLVIIFIFQVSLTFTSVLILIILIFILVLAPIDDFGPPARIPLQRN